MEKIRKPIGFLSNSRKGSPFYEKIKNGLLTPMLKIVQKLLDVMESFLSSPSSAQHAFLRFLELLIAVLLLLMVFFVLMLHQIL